VVAVEENQIVESVEVMDQLAASEDVKLILVPKRYLSGPLKESHPRSEYQRLKTDTDLIFGWKDRSGQEKGKTANETNSD